MKPRKPLRRGRAPVRRTRIKPRNEKRQDAAFVRQFGSEERVQKINRLKCLVPDCRRRSQNCHTSGRRNVTWRQVFNACWLHHEEQHRIGIKTFAEKYGVDPWARAAQLAVEIPA